MDPLTDAQLGVLLNLAEQRTGKIVPFVNIADAQHLTLLGLAIRSRQGWEITAAGSAYISRIGRLGDDAPGL